MSVTLFSLNIKNCITNSNENDQTWTLNQCLIESIKNLSVLDVRLGQIYVFDLKNLANVMNREEKESKNQIFHGNFIKILQKTKKIFKRLQHRATKWTCRQKIPHFIEHRIELNQTNQEVSNFHRTFRSLILINSAVELINHANVLLRFFDLCFFHIFHSSLGFIN